MAIWATTQYSTWQLSDALTQLRVSHSIKEGARSPARVIDCKKAQPKWVHLTTNVKNFRRTSVNFITASHAELSYTNFPRLPTSDDFLEVLKYALQYPVSVVPEVKQLTNLDYVELVAKPSLLNNIQTLVYKIQPYALRKEVQKLILQYFNSQISLRGVEHNLKRSFKTVGLIPYLREGVGLKTAVARLKAETVEAVAADTGFETFELLYLSKERKK